MNNYFIAIKPVSFDKPYLVGDKIPAEVVAPSRVKFLIEAGVIAESVKLDEIKDKESIVALLNEFGETVLKGVDARIAKLREELGISTEEPIAPPIGEIDEEETPAEEQNEDAADEIVSEDIEDITTKSYPELKELAAAKGLEFSGNISKENLLKLLQENEGNGGE